MDDQPCREIRCFFVDEAGDATLFGKGGRVLVGTEGCSKTFMLGMVWLPDPAAAEARLNQLRTELLADAYLKRVPSMQPTAAKTALYFHAKDDCPEVRREVFKLLSTLAAQVFVAIRRKSELVRIGQRARRIGAKADFLAADSLYDDLVKRLFRNHLHQADENRIVFARRGKSARIQSLSNALAKAKGNFRKKYGPREDKPTNVQCAYPSASAGLQVIDYYLWALQRLYERGEGRFFEYLRADYKLIMDLDDTTNKPYGEWYSSQKELSLETIKAL